MMSDVSKPDFRGSGILFFKNVLFYVLVMAPLVSFCLMGDKWAYLFLSVVVLTLPFLLLAGFLMSRFDRFSFNDERQQMARPFKQSIPYQSMKRIDLNETGRLLQVSVKQGLLRRTPLAYALDTKDKTRLKEELLKRLPQVVIRERRYVDWKSIGIIMALIGLMTAGFHVYLYRSHPEFRVVPQRVEWAGIVKKPKNARQYFVGQFGVVLHKRFQLTGQDESALQLEDREAKTEIKFVAGPQRNIFAQNAAFLQYATGIRDYYDVLETAYFARVGVIPLMLKMFMLSNLAEVSTYEIRQPLPQESIGGKNTLSALKGFVTQGRKRGQEVVSLVLIDTKTKAELHVFLSAPLRLDEKALREIVAGISTRPE